MPKSKNAASIIADQAVQGAATLPLDVSRLRSTRYRTATLKDLTRDELLGEAVRLKKEESIPSSLKDLSQQALSNIAQPLSHALNEKRMMVTDKKGHEKEKQLFKMRAGMTKIDGTILTSLKENAEERKGLLDHHHVIQHNQQQAALPSTAETLKIELRIRAIANNVITGLEADGRKVNRLNVTSAAKVETGRTISDVISPFVKQRVNLAHTTAEETANFSNALTNVIVRATPEAKLWNNITADTITKLKDHYAKALTEAANKPNDVNGPTELQGAISAINQRPNPQPRISAAAAPDIQPSAPLRSAELEEKKQETSVHFDSPRNAAQTQSHYQWPERAAATSAPALPPRSSGITPAAIKAQAEAKTAEHSR